MPPAAAVAAMAAVGVGGAIGAAATGAGKSRYTAQTFNQSDQYNPQAYQYGGTPGGADNAANTAGGNMNNFLNIAGVNQAAEQGQIGNQWNDRISANGARATTAADRGLAINQQGVAAQDRGVAGQSRNLSLQSRGAQGQILGMQLARARGQNLIADREAEAARRNLAVNMRSAAASARGPAALANAQSDAMAAGAQGLAGINQQATTAAQQEQAANEAAASNTATGMRTGDLSLNQNDQGQQGQDISLLGQQIGQQQVDLGQQGKDIEQQGQDINAINAYNTGAAQSGNIALGFGNLQNSIRTEQGNLSSQGGNENQLSFAQKQGIDSGTAANNAQQDMNYIKMGTGAVTGAAQAGMPAPGGAAPVPAEHGGPVSPTKPVFLVGEKGPEAVEYDDGGLGIVGQRGPELVHFQKDGVVIPAPQTRAMLGEDYRFRTAQSSMDKALATLAIEKRDMPKDFRRDTPADQARTREAYNADLMRQADEQMAGYRANLGRGAAVARDEGEIDAGPPAWLADYMAKHEDPNVRLAARCMGGPVYAREEGGPVAPEGPHPLPPPPLPPETDRGHSTSGRSLSINGREREAPVVHLAIAPPTTSDAAAPSPHELPPPKAPPIEPPPAREPVAFTRDQRPEPKKASIALYEKGDEQGRRADDHTLKGIGQTMLPGQVAPGLAHFGAGIVGNGQAMKSYYDARQQAKKEAEQEEPPPRQESLAERLARLAALIHEVGS